MNPETNQHRARVDDKGNIILPSFDQTTDFTPSVRAEVKIKGEESASGWEVEESLPLESIAPGRKSRIGQERTDTRVAMYALWNSAQKQMSEGLQSFAQEGRSQYASSLMDSRSSYRSLQRGMGGIASRTLSVLLQPVLVPRKNGPPKETSRGMLFLGDVVRFGGTFTFIFGGLFVALNYQSFWLIASPYIDPLERASAAARLEDDSMDEALREKLLRSPSLATAGNSDEDLLAYLPDVGPPDNRIIIPKLGLNVPLVTPSYQALLKEDWSQVEHDIQDALQQGVVHYPGTARPGQAGNFFVTGHSSYYPWAPGAYKSVFARLHELNPGDEYWVYYGGDKHRFIVREKKEVKPSDVTVLDQPLSMRIGTLMTCTPVGTTLRRLIVISDEVDIVTGIPLEVGEREHRELAPLPAALPI